MGEYGKRVNSIIVKNLPANYSQSELEELFSKFGRILSSKMLPSNPNFEGGCGFVNYAEPEGCTKAVEAMNNFAIDRFTLRVQHSTSRINNGNHTDRPQNGCRTNGDLHEHNGRISSPNIQNRFNGFRSAGSERSLADKFRSKTNDTSIDTNESDTLVNGHKTLYNFQQTTDATQVQNESPITIREHDCLLINKTYTVYLSNLEVPNTIFAATLDDYVHATLLITQMNKHEQLTKIQPNSYNSKLAIGQYCAALFNGDWYRARILSIDDNRAHVQYIDWGNTGSCDPVLEIRQLPNEYYKDSVLCVQCNLDGVPTDIKPTDEQTNAILEILVLDVKLEMTVSRIENGVPYVQLNLGKRNLNSEICSILSQSAIKKNLDNQIIDFDKNKPDMDLSDIHGVQLTTVDAEDECFHVLLMRDCLPTIMNILKDWNINKQPLSKPPQANMLVCAQYDGDDLWYRAWIQNVSENGFHVYFVDFGNDETVSIDRMTECPEVLTNIPWQSVQIKLANIKLTNEERYILLRDFETARLDMKILDKNQDVYSVELTHDGKSLKEYIIELRRSKEPQTLINTINKQIVEDYVEPIQPTVPKSSTPIAEIQSRTYNENTNSVPVQVRSIVNEIKSLVEVNQTKSLPPVPTINTSDSSKSLNSDENLLNLIVEQRRGNRLLEQVIAAINTTNALLAQLVQR